VLLENEIDIDLCVIVSDTFGLDDIRVSLLVCGFSLSQTLDMVYDYSLQQKTHNFHWMEAAVVVVLV
jgi:hypothetical protein